MSLKKHMKGEFKLNARKTIQHQRSRHKKGEKIDCQGFRIQNKKGKK